MTAFGVVPKGVERGAQQVASHHADEEDAKHNQILPSRGGVVCGGVGVQVVGQARGEESGDEVAVDVAGLVVDVGEGVQGDEVGV